jgi:enterochelin esterase-like enzyme
MRKYSILIMASFFLIGCTKQKEHTSIPTVSSGKVEQIEKFPSKFISSRNVDIWLPDGYNGNESYSVLYMHDGQMLFDGSVNMDNQEVGVDEVVSKLIEEKVIDKCIVVGIWTLWESRHSDYFPQKPFESLPQEYQDSLLHMAHPFGEGLLFSTKVQSDNYLKFIVQELKPYIDKNYSTRPDRKNTFIAGSSMGGLISVYAICEYPQIFGGAACLSTHWVGTFTVENNPIPEAFNNYLENNLPDPSTHKIYFDHGTESIDEVYEPFQMQVDSIMEKKGYNDMNSKTMKFERDDHSENAWGKRLHIPITFLLENTEKKENSNF